MSTENKSTAAEEGAPLSSDIEQAAMGVINSMHSGAAPEAAAPEAAAPEVDPLTAGFLKGIGQEPPSIEQPPSESDVEQDKPVTDEEIAAVEEQAKMNPRVSHAFNKLRLLAKERKEESDRLKAKLEEGPGEMTADTRAKLADELRAKEAIITELEEKIGRVSLSESPAFQRKYDQRAQAKVSGLAQSLVQFGGVDKDKSMGEAQRMLGMTPQALNEEVSGMTPLLAGAVASAWQETQAILTERQSALSEWKQTTAAIELENSQTSTKEEIATRRDAADNAIKRAAAEGCFVYNDVGTPESKEAAERYRDGFLGFVQTATQEDLIRKAADGFAAQTLYYIVNQQSEAIKQLQRQLDDGVRVSDTGVSPANPQGTPAPERNLEDDFAGSTLGELRDGIAGNAVLEMTKKLR